VILLAFACDLSYSYQYPYASIYLVYVSPLPDGLPGDFLSTLLLPGMLLVAMIMLLRLIIDVQNYE
jgi:hypothetical protein